MAAGVDLGNSGNRPSRLEANVFITVGGRDMTSAWDPRVISVEVIDKEQEMDEATIELDDGEGPVQSGGGRPGRMKLPQLGQSVGIALGWPNEGSFKVFTGYIWDIESSGQRRQGRRLRIEAKGAKQTGKQQRMSSWGEGETGESQGGGESQGKSLKEVLEDAAKREGYTINVDPELGAIKEDYWQQHNEPFHQFASRLARKYKGIFKIQGQTASVTKAEGFDNALGQTMSTVRASAGFNLLAWRIKPFVSRPVWGETKSRWFDKNKGIYNLEKGTATKSGDSVFSSAKEAFTSLWDDASKSAAESQSGSDAIASARSRGMGWVVIDGEPQAQSQGKCIVAGVREGVDGDWKIRQVEHQYSRSTGYTSRLDLIEPSLSFPSTGSVWGE
jgi:uncharacterized protein